MDNCWETSHSCVTLRQAKRTFEKPTTGREHLHSLDLYNRFCGIFKSSWWKLGQNPPTKLEVIFFWHTAHCKVSQIKFCTRVGMMLGCLAFFCYKKWHVESFLVFHRRSARFSGWFYVCSICSPTILFYIMLTLSFFNHLKKGSEYVYICYMAERCLMPPGGMKHLQEGQNYFA